MTAADYPPSILRAVGMQRRLNRVIDFIDENLDADHSLDSLAVIACLSPHHFHRVYSRHVGQSPSDTIRRLRLVRAIKEIHLQETSVTRAAIGAGYGSPQAFARAVRREFGQTATEMVATADRAHKLADGILGFDVVAMPPKSMQVHIYQCVRELGDPQVGEAQAYAAASGADPRHAMAIYIDNLFTPSTQLTHFRLCAFPGQRRILGSDSEMATVQIGDGSYARIRHRGRLLDIAPAWQRFIAQTLPEAGWKVRPGPILRQFTSIRSVIPPSRRQGFLYLPVERLRGH